VSTIKKFTFNAIYENTYIIYDETKECIIIDPGCSNASEKNELASFILSHGLKPVRLVNTHCHVDHIPGNGFVAETYSVGLEINELEQFILDRAPDYGEMFGIDTGVQPPVKSYLKEGDEIKFGTTTLTLLFTPGHSPGSLTFYNKSEKYAIVGDVLFYKSVGRFDIPGADGSTLFKSITEKLMTLPDDVKIYCGHGQETSIGFERANNPFLRNAKGF